VTGQADALFGSIRGQVALVTGAAAGIGAATAAALGRAGADVALCDRDTSGARRVADTLASSGAKARPYDIDLAGTARIPGLVSDIVTDLGHINILVNCAGIIQDVPSLFDLDEARWQRLHEVNLLAPFRLLQEVTRHMIRRGQGGRIVNVTSAAAFRAQASPAAYASSKAALTAVTRSAAAELAPHGINVNAVAPGVTATGIHGGADSDDGRNVKVATGPLANLFGRPSEPEDIAAVIVFLCLPASRQITAQTLHVSAGAVV
jgi:NAD(P)-dependent dehydrogenase (short-subunit alcohol dehydrogenase family)